MDKYLPGQSPLDKTPRTIKREFVHGAFVRVFVLGLLKIGGSDMCDVLFGGPGMCDKSVTGEGGQNWPKIA